MASILNTAKVLPTTLLRCCSPRALITLRMFLLEPFMSISSFLVCPASASLVRAEVASFPYSHSL